MAEQKEKTVAFRVSETMAASVHKQAKIEGTSAREWMEAAMTVMILQGTGYTNLEDFLKGE